MDPRKGAENDTAVQRHSADQEAKGNLRKTVENHPFFWLIASTVTGFGAGMGAYQAILEIADRETIAKGSYYSKDDVSNTTIQWNKDSNSYVLRLDESQLMQIPSPEEQLMLFEMESNSRRLIRNRFEFEKLFSIRQFDRNELPKIIRETLNEAQEIFSAPSLKTPGLIENETMAQQVSRVLIDAANQILIKRNQILKSADDNRDSALARNREASERWIPPTASNLVRLNQRERLREQIKSTYKLLYDDLAEFISAEWLPLSMNGFIEKTNLLELMENETKEERMKIAEEFLIASVRQLDRKLGETASRVEDQQEEAIALVEKNFIQEMQQDRGISTDFMDFAARLNEIFDESRKSVEDIRRAIEAGL